MEDNNTNVEPPEKMLNVTKEEALSDNDTELKDILLNGHSIIAFDTTNKHICGIVVAYTYAGKYEKTNILSDKLQTISRLYDHSLKPVEKILQKNNCAMLDYLIVDKSYQKRGIATQLVRGILSAVEAENYRYLIAIATSAFSQKILQNLNFRTIKSFPYAEYVDTLTNQKPFINPIGPHICLKTMAICTNIF